MPWMRRFGQLPTGTIDQASRTAAAIVYAGILPSAVVPIVGPCWAAGDVYVLGMKAGDVNLAGIKAADVYLPGFKAGQRVC